MDDSSVFGFLHEKMEYLKTSRPTAVNLFNALDEVQHALTKRMVEAKQQEHNTVDLRECLRATILKHAEFMLQRDVNDNRAIGKFGADAILQVTGKEKVHMVTICNTGSLATAGYGTALGVVRCLAERNQLESITALETRPYNQGSRLTAFEILEEKMPGGRLICDSAAAALMQVRLLFMKTRHSFGRAKGYSGIIHTFFLSELVLTLFIFYFHWMDGWIGKFKK